jgi:hypothetical protein
MIWRDLTLCSKTGQLFDVRKCGGHCNFTSSTVPSNMYLITQTLLPCPMRNTRPIAWLSTDGFHCGSKRWMRLATDSSLRLNAKWINHLAQNDSTARTYPTPPVPSVISRTRVDWSSRNLLSSFFRSSSCRVPSTLQNLIPSSRNSRPTRSRLFFHAEKTMLAKSVFALHIRMREDTFCHGNSAP